MAVEAAQAEQWSIVELLGHRRLAGRVSEVQRFGVTMMRIDIPRPDGTFVTQLYGGNAIFSETPTDEATVRREVGMSSSPYVYQLPDGDDDVEQDDEEPFDEDGEPSF